MSFAMELESRARGAPRSVATAAFFGSWTTPSPSTLRKSFGGGLDFCLVQASIAIGVDAVEHRAHAFRRFISTDLFVAVRVEIHEALEKRSRSAWAARSSGPASTAHSFGDRPHLFRIQLAILIRVYAIEHRLHPLGCLVLGNASVTIRVEFAKPAKHSTFRRSPRRSPRPESSGTTTTWRSGEFVRRQLPIFVAVEAFQNSNGTSDFLGTQFSVIVLVQQHEQRMTLGRPGLVSVARRPRLGEGLARHPSAKQQRDCEKEHFLHGGSPKEVNDLSVPVARVY
jgi:hypothetical protein